VYVPPPPQILIRNLVWFDKNFIFSLIWLVNMHCVGGGSPRRRPGRRMVRRGGARHLQLLPRHQQRHDVQRVPVACHRRCSPLVCRHRPTSVVAATLAAAVPANVICSRSYSSSPITAHQTLWIGRAQPSALSGSSLDENR